jgi:hypothetical protein
MTGIDLIVLAPWIVFVAGLAVICILLLRSRHASARGASAGREPARRPDPQETECRENNAEARPQ